MAPCFGWRRQELSDPILQSRYVIRDTFFNQEKEKHRHYDMVCGHLPLTEDLRDLEAKSMSDRRSKGISQSNDLSYSRTFSQLSIGIHQSSHVARHLYFVGPVQTEIIILPETNLAPPHRRFVSSNYVDTLTICAAFTFSFWISTKQYACCA